MYDRATRVRRTGGDTAIADIDPGARPRRSNLPREAARQRWIEIAEVVALEQIRHDSELLDTRDLAVGPFARLDANVVAAHDGKTRGAVTNVFGSQAALQAATMARSLSAGDWIERLEYPSPADFPTADAWADAFFGAESARGPQRGAAPSGDYAFLWALWLSTVPYGLWSEQVRRPSMEEHVQWVALLERVLGEAIDHFGLSLHDTTLNDLACAVAALVEGVWLNQCLTAEHPCDPSEPIATLLRRSGRLLWRGATAPRPGRR